MFGQTFYHKTLRKYVTLFGTLFNDVYINRANNSNTTVDTLKIPITYGPKSKTFQRLDSDPLLNRPFETSVPRMAFEMTGMAYDPARKLVSANKGYITVNPLNNGIKYAYNPVPYNIDFSLYIQVKNAEDGTRILEQILPYFTPEWTTTVNLIPDIGARLDIPVIINNVSSEDSYEGDASEQRRIIWTLNFTMKGYIFGPVKKPSEIDSALIKQAQVNFFPHPTSNTSGEYVKIYPGMLANGSPTSNASLTIDKSLIDSDDDWAFIIERGDVNNE